MTAQVFKAIGGGLLSARLVVIVEFLPCLRAPRGTGESGQRIEIAVCRSGHAGVSLPGRVARDSTFQGCLPSPGEQYSHWSKVADARTETSGDPLESGLSVFSELQPSRVFEHAVQLLARSASRLPAFKPVLAHIKNETPKKGPRRQEPGVAPPLPNSAHGDRLISAKLRGTARFLSDLHM